MHNSLCLHSYFNMIWHLLIMDRVYVDYNLGDFPVCFPLPFLVLEAQIFWCLYHLYLFRRMLCGMVINSALYWLRRFLKFIVQYICLSSSLFNFVFVFFKLSLYVPHVYGSHASTFVCLFCSVLCFVCSGGWGRENFVLICLCHQAASIIFVVFLQGRVVEIYGPEASFYVLWFNTDDFG